LQAFLKEDGVEMGPFIIRRILFIVPIILGISLITFTLMYSVPGGPFDTEGIQSEETLRALERIYNLDKPVWQQYLLYIGGIARGDFGTSFRYRNLKVSEIIMDRFQVSLTLGLVSLCFTVVLGLAFGIIGAIKQNTIIDYFVMLLATVGYSIPNFAISVILLLFFSLILGLFPVGGWGTAKHVVLPAFALSLPWVSLLARLSRASMLETLRADYIRTARAKGLKESIVIYKHALRNAAIPMVTVMGTIFSQLITGSMAIETIFGLPGIGQYMVISISSADYTMIMGLTLFFTLIVVFVNLAVDLSYAFIDPRIRHD